MEVVMNEVREHLLMASAGTPYLSVKACVELAIFGLDNEGFFLALCEIGEW